MSPTTGSFKEQPLFRIIIPAFPDINVFSRSAKITTALGPVMVATAANQLYSWRVEVIDENNYRWGPKDKNGLPNHLILQAESSASVVGFYCGLSSTIERVWRLAEFYHVQGAKTIAGGWHAHYCPEETLNHNIDVVVHGDAEMVIPEILLALERDASLENIPGISFRDKKGIKRNKPDKLAISDMNALPYPDFGLLKYAKLKIYPIGRIRGCAMGCEFCSVRGKPRWANAIYLFRVVNWLVETRRARHFFIVDDRLEEDLEGTIEFFRMISKKYGDRLSFIVQMRLEAAENSKLLKVMAGAGVTRVCIGYESPIDEQLKAMRKGYLSSQMIAWTKILRRYFRIHAMFIVGYPLKDNSVKISARDTLKKFKKFIKKSRVDSIQTLLPVPLVGTELRRRLEGEKRIFPLKIVPWRHYDGNYACFSPNHMSLREFQEIPIRLMRWFYGPFSFFRVSFRTITFPIDYLFRGWKSWLRDWYQDVIKCNAYLLIKKWLRRQKVSKFLKRLGGYRKNK